MVKFDRHPGFITEAERLEIAAWFDENLNNDEIFKTGISEGKLYKHRLTTRRSRGFSFPEIINSLFDRIIKLKGYERKYAKQIIGEGGIFAVATFPGGDTYLHTDPKAQGFEAVTFNILIQDGEAGGVLSIGDPLEEKELAERELHCYAASRHQHKVSEVKGNKNRYMLIYRLAIPRAEWESA